MKKNIELKLQRKKIGQDQMARIQGGGLLECGWNNLATFVTNEIGEDAPYFTPGTYQKCFTKEWAIRMTTSF